jgi:hypothetical protein
MSSPPNGPNPPPNSFDNMRLPAYRSSYLGRYHPYPRTRAPAREVVMVCALRLAGLLEYAVLTTSTPPHSLLRKVGAAKRAAHRLRRTPIQ